MFEQVDDLVREHAELETQLADPAIHADQGAAHGWAAATRSWRRSCDVPGVAAARRGPRHGPGAEPTRTRRSRPRRGPHGAPRASSPRTLTDLLVPRDPDDDRDVILEVKAGEGGDESALFAGDLLRMYLRYAERRGWKTEVLDAQESDLGGYKDVSVAVKARGTPSG